MQHILIANVVQKFLKSLLDVGDNLERAYSAIPAEALQGKDSKGNRLTAEATVSLLNSLINGVKLTEKIFDQVSIPKSHS